MNHNFASAGPNGGHPLGRFASASVRAAVADLLSTRREDVAAALARELRSAASDPRFSLSNVDVERLVDGILWGIRELVLSGASQTLDVLVAEATWDDNPCGWTVAVLHHALSALSLVLLPM